MTNLGRTPLTMLAALWMLLISPVTLLTPSASIARELNVPQVPFGQYKGYNVIYVQMESIQQFLIGAKVDGREITPILNDLASRGIYFSRCYAQTGMGNTSDAELLALCSILPLKDSAAFNLMSKPTPSLPRALKSFGYHTYAFHGNSPSVWNRKKVYPMVGIDRYYHRWRLVNDQTVGLGISDLSLSRQASRILTDPSRVREPFFALYMTLSSHHPYKVDQVWGFDPGTFRGTVLGDYLASANYADHAIGKLIDTIAQSPMGGRTIVVIYGDHRAPGLPEEEVNQLLTMNRREPMGNEPWNVRDFGRVPLIFLIPDGSGDYIQWHCQVPCGQIDIAPTVAHLLGFAMPDALGEDLLGSPRGMVAFPQDEIIYKDYWSAFDGRYVVDMTLSARVMPMVLNPQWETARRIKEATLSLLQLKR